MTSDILEVCGIFDILDSFRNVTNTPDEMGTANVVEHLPLLDRRHVAGRLYSNDVEPHCDSVIDL